jgi:hypothetical protein
MWSINTDLHLCVAIHGVQQLMPNVESSRRSIQARLWYLLDLTDKPVLHATDDP